MTKTKAVRFGYVGCGVMGQVYMTAAEGNEQIVSAAVADTDEKRARAAAERFGIAQVYTNADDLFADPNIDAVVLALPASLRTALALKAFQAGKHVLTEKPVAMNATEVEQLIAARGSLVAGCCSARLRCQDSADTVVRVLEQGRLGELRVLRSRWVAGAGERPEKEPPAWRLSTAVNGGGNLANLGSYALDYFLGVFGWSLAPVTVVGKTWGIPKQFHDYVAPGSDAESLTSAMITFTNGAVLMMEQGEFAVAKQDYAWQIAGTEGTLTFRILPSNQEIVLEQYRNGAVEQEVVWEGTETFPMMQKRLLGDFASAVLEGRQPKTSLEQALVVRRLIDAIYMSSRTGKAVQYDELYSVSTEASPDLAHTSRG